jgi:hypothetical protein
MRAISPIAHYGITVQSPRAKRGMDQAGQVVEYFDGDLIHAQFETSGLTEWEQIFALENFDFSGLPDGVNPLTRVSVFDSEAYVQRFPKDEREAILKKVDERLEELQTIFPSEFRIVEKPRQLAPWPTYDTTALEDSVDEETGEVKPGILSLQRVSGWSPEQIRLYEVENANRSEVIAAMEALEAEAAGEPYGEAISIEV